MHILVVDDNAPDGTIEVVVAYRERFANIHALQAAQFMVTVPATLINYF